MLGSWLRPLSWSASGAVVSAAAVLLVVGPGLGGGLAARVDPQAGSLQLAARETTAPNHLIPSAQMVSNGASNPRGWSQGASVRDVSLNAGGQLSGSQTAPQAGFFSPSDRFSSPSSSPLAETSVPSISEAIAAALAARARRESELGTGAALGTRRGRRSLYEAAIPSFAVGSRADSSTRQAPRAVEVDWMRSDGRVQVFHDPVEQVSFIWVNPSRAMIERNAALPSVDGADLVLGGMLGEDPPAAAFDSGVVGLGARVHSSQASASSAGL